MESQKPPRKSGINPIWWVIMLGLLAWNVYAGSTGALLPVKPAKGLYLMIPLTKE